MAKEDQGAASPTIIMTILAMMLLSVHKDGFEQKVVVWQALNQGPLTIIESGETMLKVALPGLNF